MGALFHALGLASSPRELAALPASTDVGAWPLDWRTLRLIPLVAGRLRWAVSGTAAAVMGRREEGGAASRLPSSGWCAALRWWRGCPMECAVGARGVFWALWNSANGRNGVAGAATGAGWDLGRSLRTAHPRCERPAFDGTWRRSGGESSDRARAAPGRAQAAQPWRASRRAGNQGHGLHYADRVRRGSALIDGGGGNDVGGPIIGRKSTPSGPGLRAFH